MDPFSAKPSMILFCDIIEPSTGQVYARDPRSTSKKAEAYVKSSGIGDMRIFGPEAEFFIFDSVKYGTGGNFGIYQLDSQEGPQASMKDIRKATWATVPPSRAAISRCRRSTPTATCAPRCCRRWARWVSDRKAPP